MLEIINVYYILYSSQKKGKKYNLLFVSGEPIVKISCDSDKSSNTSNALVHASVFSLSKEIEKLFKFFADENWRAK